MLRRWRSSIERFLLFHLVRLFRIRGQSERVARGFALGLVVNFFPTFGFGVVISASVARLLGGNAIAGFAGGALLNFFWPVLFYLNLRTGGLFVKPPVAVEHLEDVTPATMNTLLWGQTFTVGALANGAVVGLAVYVVLRLLHRKMRPAALAGLRGCAARNRARNRRRA